MDSDIADGGMATMPTDDTDEEKETDSEAI